MSFFDDEADSGEREYTVREKALRDIFVTEYLKDFDAFTAALRCGFSSAAAAMYSQRFMEESYVQREIKIRELSLTENELEETAIQKRKIMAALFREAHYRGPGSSQSARVNALRTLASITGLDKVSSSNGVTGGVMVVP